MKLNDMISTTTDRGFELIKFADDNGCQCSLQQSSAIDQSGRGLNQPGSSFVWIGREGERMHLSRDHVETLIPLLQQWMDTGSFSSQVGNAS